MDENKIDQLVKMELQESYVVHGGFNSTHEGYAVLLEEVEEAQEEVAALDNAVPGIWEAIKQGRQKNVAELARKFKTIARRALEEIIQVEAMSEKLIEFIEGEELRE